MTHTIKYTSVILLGLVLAGCATTGPGPSVNLNPVCDALIGPIKYNSTKKDSTRYAGKALVPDLKAHNRVGQNLGCAAYR